MEITMEKIQNQTIKRTNPEIYFTVDVDAIRERALFKVFKPRQIVFLQILFSYANKSYISEPPLRTVAKQMGVTEKTAQSILRGLRKKDFNGEKVLTITKGKREGHPHFHNIYHLSHKLGINIFKPRDEILALKKGMERNLPIKNTQSTKKNQFIKEEPKNFSFNESNGNRSHGFEPLKDLIQARGQRRDLEKAIAEISEKLAKNRNPESHDQAIRIVKSHVEKLGEGNWRKLNELYKEHGIKLYNQVTYKVLREKVPFEEAVKLLLSQK